MSETEGARRRDEAITRVERHTEPEWRMTAETVVQQLAERQKVLTAEDVLAIAGTPREPRAVGPLMVWAQGRGYIAPTGLWSRSKRPQSHRGPIRIWRSLIHPETAAVHSDWPAV